jgi:hypothetical protein
MSLLTLFMIVGPIAILAGVAMMVIAIRSGGVGETPRSTVMLMAGMMACAFGMILTDPHRFLDRRPAGGINAMTARYAPYSLRSWLIVAAFVVPYLLLKEAFGITYPSWVQWIGIAATGLVGGAILVRPDLAATKNLTVARLIGAALVAGAGYGAYSQFTKIPVE